MNDKKSQKKGTAIPKLEEGKNQPPNKEIRGYNPIPGEDIARPKIIPVNIPPKK